MPPKHMISFFSTDVPSIYYWEGEEEASAKLEGKLRIEFEGPKACVGFKSRNSRHRCPYHYEGRIQCPFCGSKDISRIYTRHDFMGYEELQEEFSEKEFSLYLVSFGERVKCGVTQKGRLEDRVKEQGADYYAEIMQLKGAEAYEMERLLQSHFGFSNAVQARTKLKLLGREDPRFLENAIIQVESTAPFNEYMLDCPTPKRLEYPVPEKYSVSENIDGKVIGAKGPLLFFENSSGSYVSNLKAQSGRFFTVQEQF